MAAPNKTPTTADEIEARAPGGDAFALPDLPDVMTGWVSMTAWVSTTARESLTASLWTGRRRCRGRAG